MTSSPVPDFQEFLANAQAFEGRMRSARGRLAELTVTGGSTDGTVTVVASGLGELREVRIDPRVFEERDAAALQEAVAEAIRAAGSAAAREATARMGPVEISLY